MDIAKYMVTAILLSSVFENPKGIKAFVLCFIVALSILIVGLLMVKDENVDGKAKIKKVSISKEKEITLWMGLNLMAPYLYACI